jgi:hypothetical protein
VGHDSFFDHPDWEPGFSATYAGSTVDGIVVSFRSVLDEDAVQPLPDAPDECFDGSGNDGVPPPSTRPGSLGGFVSPTADVPVDVVGPTWQSEVITGSGDFSDISSMHRHVQSSGALFIDEWIMIEAAPTVVGTSSIEADVAGFQLQLVNAETVPVVGGGWGIAAGNFLFHLGATIDGQGSAVLATNKDKITFFQAAGGVGQCPATVGSCLVSRAFTIEYDDAFGGSWELEIPLITWMP